MCLLMTFMYCVVHLVCFSITGDYLSHHVLPFRCTLPGYPNDTFEIQNEYHESLVNSTIPNNKMDGEDTYDTCLLYQNGTNVTTKCDSWVYDTSVFGSTFVTKVRCGNIKSPSI